MKIGIYLPQILQKDEEFYTDDTDEEKSEFECFITKPILEFYHLNNR